MKPTTLLSLVVLMTSLFFISCGRASNTSSGKVQGHEYVDLGLSVKWATCNIGADEPSDYGDYFAWGETTTKSEYFIENSQTNGISMGSICGDPQYDAATANWGDSWRLPTKAEIEELKDKCTWTWTEEDGHNGYKVTGKNGKSIFLPAAGIRYGMVVFDGGNYGDYWSGTPYKNKNSDSGAYSRRWPTRAEREESENRCEREWTEVDGHNHYQSGTPHKDTDNGAYDLSFYANLVFYLWGNRYSGLSVRPVTE